MIKNLEKQLTEIFENIQDNYIKTSKILSRLSYSYNEDPSSKYPLTSIIKLYLFRLIKGLKNYEILKDYLNKNESEAFELGFFKGAGNKLDLPPKRTYNNYLSKLSPEEKEELNKIAEKILLMASDKRIVLDLEIVKKAIEESTKLTETDIDKVSKVAKKIFYSKLDLKIRNTGKFCSNNVFDILNYISFSHSFANDGSRLFKENCKDKKVPNGDTFMYHIKKYTIHRTLDMFDKISLDVFNYIRTDYRILNKRKLDIAFDVHNLDYWGKKAEYVCGGKDEHGTTNFFKFLTCSIVTPGFRFIIDVVPIHPINSIDKLLDKSLAKIRNKIRINQVYLDRGFNSVKIIRVLKKHKIKFIMPVQRWDTVKSYFEKDQSNIQDAMVFEDFIIGDKNNNEKVNLVIVKDDSGEKHPFITNLDIAPCLAYRLYGWYSQRWGIETCYRLLDKDLRPRTTSNNYNIRLFYFLYSCNLYNIWVLINIQTSMIIYGRNNSKPLISVKRILVALYQMDIDSFDNGG